MIISLTKHAEDRLLTRTNLSKEEFEMVYKEEKILPIGKEKKSSRLHELFYSKPKDQCFVSIRDERNSEIITILPIDYHQNIAWTIAPDTQQMAKDLALGNKIFGEEELMIEHQQETPSKFKVVAIDPVNYKRKNITSFNAEEFSFDIDILLSDQIFRKTLRNFFKENDSNKFLECEIIFGKDRRETKLISTSVLLFEEV